MNETLRRAAQDAEEERLWKEQKEKMKLTKDDESFMVSRGSNISERSIAPAPNEIQQLESYPSSDDLVREVFRSTKLINSSATDLHSHMRDILNPGDVRPIIDRTEQATACAREIALLMKAQGDLLRAIREPKPQRDRGEE